MESAAILWWPSATPLSQQVMLFFGYEIYLCYLFLTLIYLVRNVQPPPLSPASRQKSCQWEYILEKAFTMVDMRDRACTAGTEKQMMGKLL